MKSITQELRDYAEIIAMVDAKDVIPAGVANHLRRLADRIDETYERRMVDCRREVKRDACSYLRSVMWDYERDVRRIRRTEAKANYDRIRAEYESRIADLERSKTE